MSMTYHRVWLLNSRQPYFLMIFIRLPNDLLGRDLDPCVPLHFVPRPSAPAGHRHHLVGKKKEPPRDSDRGRLTTAVPLLLRVQNCGWVA